MVFRITENGSLVGQSILGLMTVKHTSTLSSAPSVTALGPVKSSFIPGKKPRENVSLKINQSLTVIVGNSDGCRHVSQYKPIGTTRG